MKKFAKILVVSMLLFAVTLSFASCGVIKEKLGLGFTMEKLQEKLKDEGYVVETVTNEYYVFYQLNVLFPYVELDERPEEIMTAFQEKGNDVFYALKFEDKEIAEEAFAVLEPEIEYFIEEYNENLEKLEKDAMDFTWKRKGDIIYFGTVDAVKAAIGLPGSLFVFKK